ncbi:aminotransferase-like domain-containing protein [Photobacterium ganghwense]|uniref:aminotransferase-like domain-containing protein n=1 Tax=Photobacterium ganghwense TaxID=320778 RepID=UPI001C2D97FF|nr:PLP-dependent aminotransferase family protein [Photobacterium ganghwense]MBV1842726.1 PLP-dependent aminotransferase family protein [Photobacterium ganghwense]
MSIIYNNLRLSEIPQSLNAVNLLNEISSNYPDAISFTSGSPCSESYGLEKYSQYINSFMEINANRSMITNRSGYHVLGNYSSSGGFINAYIKQHLEADDQIVVDTDDIVLTCGAQEAILLTLQALFKDKHGSLVIVSPFYSGVDGAAKLLEIDTYYVNETNDGVDIESFANLIDEFEGTSKEIKVIYCTPNFSNPSGTLMSDTSKQSLISLCRTRGILIIEDNTYGHIGYDIPVSPLKYWDDSNNVIYISSFSKTMCPGVRVGYVVAGQKIKVGSSVLKLSKIISTYKSLGSNHVPGLIQAFIAGALEENDFSVRKIISQKVKVYKEKRNYLDQCLKEMFGDKPGYNWTVPDGGFFSILTLPFLVDEDDMNYCAKTFGVIWLPMSLFTVNKEQTNKIRLSFSNVSLEQINMGVKKLSNFIEYKTKGVISEVQL